MSDALLHLRRVGYRYPEAQEPSLRGIDLEIGHGEFVVLAGRSGSGKSSLLRAACGLIPHFHGGEFTGSLTLAGLDLRDSGPGEFSTLAGFVAQEPESQALSTTARNEIALPLELREVGAAEQARAVEEAALALGVAGLLDRTTDTLSGGELQRVALAAALVARPAIVLLDEPTSQLDPVGGDELIGLLRRVNETWGTTVICAEHRLERCLPAADRVIVLADGQLAFDGEPEACQAWALEHDPALATPAARLFGALGLQPLPCGVKQARATLRERGLAPARDADPAPATAAEPHRPRRSRFPKGRSGPAPSLQARGLWFEHTDAGETTEVLRGLDLRVAAGERVALMGRNGAGKSTLLRCAAGLLEPRRGTVRANGDVALLTQTPSDYLVRERVADELPGAEGAAWLDRVGLAGRENADPRQLSGGEQQRLALALVLAGRPPGGTVLLDEPTRGMDSVRKDELTRMVCGLAADGAAVVVATHDVEFAARFAERVVLVGEGRVLADGLVGDVLSGGWYFSTEIARVLAVPGAVTVDDGVARLQAHAAPIVGAGVGKMR
ncbi:MAG: ABC transporter ATP-binding protein [Solirubrobacterales bacterium]